MSIVLEKFVGVAWFLVVTAGQAMHRGAATTETDIAATRKASLQVAAAVSKPLAEIEADGCPVCDD